MRLVDWTCCIEEAGIEAFHDVIYGLRVRGLTLPAVPSAVAAGRDDRDVLWKVYEAPLRDEGAAGQGQP